VVPFWPPLFCGILWDYRSRQRYSPDGLMVAVAIRIRATKSSAVNGEVVRGQSGHTMMEVSPSIWRLVSRAGPQPNANAEGVRSSSSPSGHTGPSDTYHLWGTLGAKIVCTGHGPRSMNTV
jgi:hypothetical protein